MCLRKEMYWKVGVCWLNRTGRALRSRVVVWHCNSIWRAGTSGHARVALVAVATYTEFPRGVLQGAVTVATKDGRAPRSPHAMSLGSDLS